MIRDAIWELHGYPGMRVPWYAHIRGGTKLRRREREQSHGLLMTGMGPRIVMTTLLIVLCSYAQYFIFRGKARKDSTANHDSVSNIREIWTEKVFPHKPIDPDRSGSVSIDRRLIWIDLIGKELSQSGPVSTATGR